MTDECIFLRERFAALYTLDERARLVQRNAPEGGPVPAVHVQRGRERSVVAVSAALPEALARALLERAEAEPGFTDPRAAPGCGEKLRSLLGIAAHERPWEGPAFEVDPVADGDATGVVDLGPGEEALLTGELEPWRADLGQLRPLVAVLEGGVVQCVCASVRMGDVVHEAGVETAGGARRRGHGLAAARGWARRVQGAGRIAVWSTRWENVASCGLAARLGVRLRAVDFQLG